MSSSCKSLPRTVILTMENNQFSCSCRYARNNLLTCRVKMLLSDKSLLVYNNYHWLTYPKPCMHKI